MKVLGTRFSITDIIIITVGIICLVTLGLVIGFGLIFIAGVIILVIIDSIYLIYYVRSRKERE
ncbi:MAG: hypothetical protein AM326_09045 [Candidatus Thorarchaeota archaeon SMTZ-45]|nr:MAG: hypothetical protein AM325_07445 [Candidatus Thorarchaeota archaeon SMTZ1-45]KXH75337.1 MAG: hypothetical protein AM326_09045 [Candidatus Thorarchaeota archaeon SMTZ-45]